MNAFGLEEGDDRMNGLKSCRVERGIEREGLAGVDAHDFKAEDFFFDLGRESGVKKRVLVEEGCGFG